ncbi:hypothetical protein ACQZV8_19200 [Magnetococcales bacterium HHB-1]
MVGFSAEAVVDILSAANGEDPLSVVVDAVKAGDIRGIVHFGGCNNYRVPQDKGFIDLATRFAKDDMLILATGCAAGAFAKHGFLSPDSTDKLCGERSAAVRHALAKAAGMDRPLPPVLHMGSCVDNSRAAHLAMALADHMGVDVDQLPLVVSAPEIMHEKAISIVMWAGTLGVTVHLGVAPPVLGAKGAEKLMTKTLKDLTGAHYIIETDFKAAYTLLRESIDEKRMALGLV